MINYIVTLTYDFFGRKPIYGSYATFGMADRKN